MSPEKFQQCHIKLYTLPCALEHWFLYKVLLLEQIAWTLLSLLDFGHWKRSDLSLLSGLSQADQSSNCRCCGTYKLCDQLVKFMIRGTEFIVTSIKSTYWNQSVMETLQINLHQSPASSGPSEDAMVQKATGLQCEQIIALYVRMICSNSLLKW